MRPHVSLLLTLVAIVALPAGSQAQEDAAADARYEAALAWVDLLVEGDFEEAAEQVNEAVSAQLGAAQLEGAWTQLSPQLGTLDSIEPKAQVMQQGFHVVILKGVFAAGTFDVQVVMADDHSVAGFFVRPPS
jgi:hypothetical protein